MLVREITGLLFRGVVVRRQMQRRAVAANGVGLCLGRGPGANTTSAMPSRLRGKRHGPAVVAGGGGHDARAEGVRVGSISASSALNAPRILNEWVRFSDSSFSSTRRPAVAPSGSDSRSGVGVRCR